MVFTHLTAPQDEHSRPVERAGRGCLITQLMVRAWTPPTHSQARRRLPAAHQHCHRAGNASEEEAAITRLVAAPVLQHSHAAGSWLPATVTHGTPASLAGRCDQASPVTGAAVLTLPAHRANAGP